MLGMVHFLPTSTLHLFKGSSSVVVPTFVVLVYPAGLIRRPGKLADIVGKLTKTLLALAQRLLLKLEARHLQTPDKVSN